MEFDLKSVDFDLKSVDFDLKSVYFDLKSVDFDLKSEDSDLKFYYFNKISELKVYKMCKVQALMEMCRFHARDE